MKKANHPDFKKEATHLKETYSAVVQEIERLESECKVYEEKVKVAKKSRGAENKRYAEGLEDAWHLMKRDLERCKRILQETYFGRFDFLIDEEYEAETYYLGYLGFKEIEESGHRIISWKAPMAEVFYRDRGRIEKLRTTLEGHAVSGETKLKRRLVTEYDQLLNMEDISSGKAIIDSIAQMDPSGNHLVDTEDSILMEILEEETDAKLKDIIRSIQAEQDDIIRLPLNRVLVVQGVAGSGKSTVGLHRIAYLLYNYQKALSEDTVLVLVPNPQFIEYIQELLPMLETESVKQYTFEKLALEVIDLNMPVVQLPQLPEWDDPENELFVKAAKDSILSVMKGKGGDGMIQLIDAYVESLYKRLSKRLTTLSHEASGFHVTAAEQQKYVVRSVPYNKILQDIRGFLESKWRVFFDPKKAAAEYNYAAYKAIEVLEADVKAYIQKYLEALKAIDVLMAYKHFMKTPVATAQKLGVEHFDIIAHYTLEILESKRLERKDLSILSYLKLAIDGKSTVKAYKHIFIDEAQDYSPMEFLMVKGMSENQSLTIMGDINQGIYLDKGLSDWSELTEGVFKELRPTQLALKDSYRSTFEIVTYANQLIQSEALKARPVKRKGADPKVLKFSTIEEGIAQIQAFALLVQEEGFKTAAVIIKDVTEGRKIAKRLSEETFAMPHHMILSDEDPFLEGISILPVDRSKGLEFDAALVWDASEALYEASHDQDRKLLYVALTRPKHLLWVNYNGSLTPWLQ